MIFNKWNDSCILQPLPVTSAQWFSGVTHTIHAAAVKALTSYSREGGHVYTVLKILAAQKFLLEDFFVSLNKHVLTSAISCRRHSPLVILAKTAGEKKIIFLLIPSRTVPENKSVTKLKPKLYTPKNTSSNISISLQQALLSVMWAVLQHLKCTAGNCPSSGGHSCSQHICSGSTPEPAPAQQLPGNDLFHIIIFHPKPCILWVLHTLG